MIDLGCITICDALDTQLLATETGDYVLKGKFNGRFVEKSQPFDISDPLVFDTDGLPESYTLDLELFSPSGILIDTIKVLILGIIKN